MNVAIIGAGLMGRVLATALHQAKCSDITLIDKDDYAGKNSPAYIAAGMLAHYCESIQGGKLIYELGSSSLSLWQKYLDLIDGKHLYNNRGTLLLAEDNFAAELTHYLAKIKFNTTSKGFCLHLDNADIIALEPELNFKSAYLVTEEASLNAREVYKQLGNYLLDKVKWYNLSNIEQINDNKHLKINDVYHKFNWIIDCRGMGSKAIMPNLRGIRGEIMRIYAPHVNISRPIRLFHPRHNIYINPYANNHYIIGATEIESEDYSPVSAKSCSDLINYACTIHSGFAEGRILELNSSCRPTLPDNLPHIKLKDNYISINGLYRHGYLIAPALANIVTGFLNDGSKNYQQIWS